MTAGRTVRISCDWPSCYMVEYGWFSVAEARTDLAKRGWARVAGLDFCGPGHHEPDHAAKVTDGHTPAFERVPKFRTRRFAACSCGWVDDPADPWPGRTQSSAIRAWQDHIRIVEGLKPIYATLTHRATDPQQVENGDNDG